MSVFEDSLDPLLCLRFLLEFMEFFCTVPDLKDLRFLNDDLVGIFDSVPKCCMLESVGIFM